MEIAWDMWEHRNGIKHSDDNNASLKREHEYLDSKIKEEVQEGTNEVAQADKAHFDLLDD